MPTDSHAQLHVRWNCVHGLPKLLVYGLVLQLGLGLGTGNGYFIAFCSSCPKVTNTFVLPSWPGAWSNSYLAGAR